MICEIFLLLNEIVSSGSDSKQFEAMRLCYVSEINRL